MAPQEGTSDPKALIAALKDVGPVKVWSLLVTIFGDLSEAHGGFLTSRQLNGLFDAFDIQSGALRVALHRLRKDGWIESERIGRISRFKMTEQAQKETDKARPVVYRAPSDHLESWVFVVSNSPLPSGAVRLNKVMACPARSESRGIGGCMGDSRAPKPDAKLVGGSGLKSGTSRKRRQTRRDRRSDGERYPK